MKRLIFTMVLVLPTLLIAACGVPKSVKHTYSSDGKHITYKAMKLLAPVQFEYITIVTDGPTTIPPQTLKAFAQETSWDYYQADTIVPRRPDTTAEGLAIHKIESNRYAYWILLGGRIILAYQSLRDLEYELVDITEPVQKN